jgi:flagellar biosynthesis/type III secretory pathway protein FliH
MVQEALEEGREAGLEQGREAGLEQGREQGRDESRHALLDVAVEKFGPLPDAIVVALLNSSGDFAAAARAVVRSTSVADLKLTLS